MMRWWEMGFLYLSHKLPCHIISVSQLTMSSLGLSTPLFVGDLPFGAYEVYNEMRWLMRQMRVGWWIYKLFINYIRWVIMRDWEMLTGKSNDLPSHLPSHHLIFHISSRFIHLISFSDWWKKEDVMLLNLKEEKKDLNLVF